MNKHTLLGITFLFFSANTMADLPLSLKEIYTDKGKIKLESSIAYSNSERTDIGVGNPVMVQTTNNSFVTIPSVFSQTKSNSDIIVGNIGLRYGLTGKTDIYANSSYLYNSSRSFDGVNEYKISDNHLSDINLGISHTFLQDGKNPAVIGFVETSLYEKVLNKSSSAKSWVVGATTYKAIDPVVLSLTSSYRWNGKRNSEWGIYKPANYFLISPSVSFAANDRISFTGSVQWINRQPEKLNQIQLSSRNTATYAKLGVGLGLSDKISISASARFKVSGESSSELNLGLTHLF